MFQLRDIAKCKKIVKSGSYQKLNNFTPLVVVLTPVKSDSVEIAWLRFKVLH